jgi:hypothetical protein
MTVTLGAAQNVNLPTNYSPVPYTSGAISLPAGSGTATLTVSQTVVPSGAAVLDVAHMRGGKVQVDASSGAPYNTLLYITLAAPSSSALTLDGTPDFTLTFASAPTSSFYLAEYIGGYWETIGEFTASGDTISVPSTSGTQTVAAGSALYFAIYTGGVLPVPNINGCVGAQGESTTRRASANAQAVGIQPIGSGTSYSYAGTLLETIARSSPCPIPTTTSSATVSVTASMTSAPTAGQMYENDSETDAYLTESTTTNTQALVEASTYNGASSFSELNETTTDEVGDSIVTTYTTPLVYAIASPLPYSGTITNAPPGSVNATLADGSTQDRTYNSDGSYSETDTIAGITGSNQIVVNSNDSGSYTIQTPNFGFKSIVFAFSAPSGGNITLTPTLNGTVQAPLTYPQWFTPGTALYSDATKGEASAALPPPCAPTGGPSSADGFVRTISILDPALGYTDTRTIASYVAPDYTGSTAVGPVCVVISDTEDIYYDYFLDTPFSLFVSPSGTPIQTDTISEAYWFSSAPTVDDRARASAENPQSISGLAASIAAHAAGIEFTRAMQREQRIETFMRGIATRRFGGVK